MSNQPDRRQRRLRGTVLAALFVVLVATAAVLLRGCARSGTAQTPAGETAQEAVTFNGEQLPVLGDVAKNTYDKSKFSYDENGRLQYAGAETFFGIDVSAHREDLDWAAVKAAGVDFAMLRIGWRGNTEGNIYEDEYFEQNFAAARAQGIAIGVYFYSQAVSAEEAAAEAKAVLGWLGGRKLDYPVVFDWEHAGAGTRSENVEGPTLDACANAFCSAVAAGGYRPMIYFYQDIAYNRYDLSQISSWPFWLAEYTSSDAPAPGFYYDFKMLQYSNSGRIAGIDDALDFDLSFVDYSKQTS